MKIEIPLTNAVRFPLGSDTALHVTTEDVDPNNPLFVKPEVGPALFLSEENSEDRYPATDTPTPYGSGVSAITGYLFSANDDGNFATTARSGTPTLPSSLDIRSALRVSLFLRPDSDDTGGEKVLIAGVPDRFGLYQQDQTLLLRLKDSFGLWSEDELYYTLETDAWHLLEVQWSRTLNGGQPMWYVNGIRVPSAWGTLTIELSTDGDRFNLAHDPTRIPLVYWRGAVRDLELSRAAIWVNNATGTDAAMHARAMRLFGLAGSTTPVPSFNRDSLAWIRVGGVRHKVSLHHPRASGMGTLVEEERTNVITDSDPGIGPWTISETLDTGRYTTWFEQECNENETPVTLWVKVGSDTFEEVKEGEPLIVGVLTDFTNVTIENRSDEGKVTHLQLEAGVGPTSPIITTSGPVTRAVETLAYPLAEADLDQEQGGLDLQVTPQLTGVRAEVGDTALAGDILSLSLTREEVVSVDGSDDIATLPGAGLWQAGKTRSFHVEWQPGTRLLVEESLGLVAGADYSGNWPIASGYLYVGGGISSLRANSYFKRLVLDDQVARFHADLHRFMVRQFGVGGFSEDEGSYFRRWRRVEGDGLALQTRLGDDLKAQAFADSVTVMLDEWEQAIGIPTPLGATEADRQSLLADLFKALGATDAELEERVTYLTGAAVVIERHAGDVGPDLREMYEYYVKIPESGFREAVLGLLRYLLERQEPAHTVGWPIVRTEFVTSSDTYGNVDLGIENEPTFAELASMTERDCVGLPSNSHLLPQGQWLPTNKNHLVRDFWKDAYADIPLPEVLFPFTEPGGSVFNGNESLAIYLTPENAPDYQRTCTGLSVADKQQEIDNSIVKLNIHRGVELVDESADCFAAASSALPDLQIFNLGTERSGAFLHLFRLSRPIYDIDEGNLFYCTYGDGGFVYRVFVDEMGILSAQFGTVSPEEIATATITDAAIQPGEWVCVLTVVDQEVETSRRLRLFGSHSEQVAEAVIEAVGWPEGDVTFSLGGPSGAVESAPAHHAYFAAWMGPYAATVDKELLWRFWRALNPAWGLKLSREDGDPAVGWPVGRAPDDPDIGVLVSKTNRGQFPYAAMGHLHDGEGLVYDVRGYGCNRPVTNHAPFSESFDEGTESPFVRGWTMDGDWTPKLDRVVSPEGLKNALEADISGTVEMYTDFDAEPGAEYCALSCWVRLEEGALGIGCHLFARDMGGSPQELEPVYALPETPELTDKWQRLVAIFRVPEGVFSLEAGLQLVEPTGLDTVGMALWGYQIAQQPILGPYVANHGSEPVEATGTELSYDPEDFPGYQDRGFASFRVKLEEKVDLLDDDRVLVLFQAVNRDDPLTQFAVLTLQKVDGTPTLTLTLAFQREVEPGETEEWIDSISYSLGEVTGDANWANPQIEHHLALAWDLSRPVALSDRHLALWVDGQQATQYAALRPADPMDQQLTLDMVYIGCGVPPEWVDSPIWQVGHQPNAVFREVELYTRHHPGLYTPTRLEMRTEEELTHTAS
jgi:hypothetical protein